MTDVDTKGCVLQMEYKRKKSGSTYHLNSIAKEAMEDTLANGGTFVLVAGPDRVTIIQRVKAEQL